MRKIKYALLGAVKHVRRGLKKRPVSNRFLHENVPYFSQWESPELVEAILNKEVRAEDDPNWKNSGATNKEEYAAWSWNGCGMACTKMIVAHRTGKLTPLVVLGKKCTDYGGYTRPVEESVGLIYNPYISFLEKEFGFHARAVLPLLLTEIFEEISKSGYVVASVSPQIRQVTDRPRRKGGHLVLILGYDLDKQELYFHNPSGFRKETQEYASISFSDFKKFFGGRGVVVTAS